MKFNNYLHLPVEYSPDALEDLRSGEAHRVARLLLSFLLKFTVVGFIVASFAPIVVGESYHGLAAIGGGIVALLGTFLKLS